MDMQGTYEFQYGPNTPYAHAMALVERHRARGGEVLLDLGCGYGAIAEPVRDLGIGYLGVDLDPGGVKALNDRDMEAVVGDLCEPEALVRELAQVLAGRPVAAITMLDTVEHLPNADEVLRCLCHFAHDLGGVPLVVSIPNVSHVDLAVKLLLGRWDVTPTGLLDATHVRFFSPRRLDETLTQAGWVEVDANDFELTFSDQHFPADAVALQRETPLGALLDGVRRAAAPGALTNQFVRAYVPRRAAMAAEPASGPEEDTPFLSVLVRTQGRRPTTLVETLLSLAAQTCDDFEVLVLGHDLPPARYAEIDRMVSEFHGSFSRRVRLVPVTGGGRSRPLNVGARQARGRYLVALDDDDMAFAHWVESLRDTAERAPGHVLHIGVARQDLVHRPGGWSGDEGGYDVVSKPRREYPLKFDLLEHLHDNRTPNNGYAVPRSFVVDLGHEWDETLPVLEDWEFLLRSASTCGVESAGVVGALARVWVEGENSLTLHGYTEWEQARAAVAAKLNSGPLLMGKGTMSRVSGV
ncbi:MAG TPA: methyltransferase domain-containing protein, partial [Acidimicrobiales bacterium]|nr:methyltransferase domain-containing protein [Acidimicrobiales bacterium]